MDMQEEYSLSGSLSSSLSEILSGSVSVATFYKGEKGNNELEVSDTEPTEETIEVWLDTSEGESIDEVATKSDIDYINSSLETKANDIKIDLVKFGAKFDGINDDSFAFNNAIAYAKTKKGSLSTFVFKTGKMRIQNKITTIDFAFNFVGDGVARTDDVGTIIYDDRPLTDMTPLFTFYRSAIKIVGGGIKDIRIDGNKQERTCIYANGLGWDWNVENVQINDFYGHALDLEKVNDTNYYGLFINNCGSGVIEATDTPKYALNIRGGTNAQHFTNCHFEHCRYFMKEEGCFNNTFISCKFEQSTRGVDSLNLSSPILLQNPRQTVFSECFFISIGFLNYIDYGFTPSQAPYFIGTGDVLDTLLTSLTFTSCSFMCGAGSDDFSSKYGNEYAKFLKTSVGGVFIGNTFLNVVPCYQSISINKDSTFTNNVIITKAYGEFINGQTVSNELRNIVMPIYLNGDIIFSCNRMYDHSFSPETRVSSVALNVSPTSNIKISDNIFYNFISNFNSEDKISGLTYSSNVVALVNNGGKLILDQYNKTIKTGVDNQYDLGALDYKFKDLYINGFIKTKGFTTRPSLPVYGMMLLDANINKWVWYNGTAWKDFLGNTV